ncbi:hypothetical protein ACDA63_13130 [Uliginosibacterium sp. sgz301328]|uniref:LIC_13387 family protein n=1 Tax=Uliginosibacterium sp. sgz301328 TaxID=3243764 RepID=UPI00359E4CBE
MRPSFALRLAAITTLLYGIAHTWALYTIHARDSLEGLVLYMMRSHDFDFGGTTHSYWDTYFGFGLLVSVWLFVLGVLAWQMGSLVEREPAHARPLMLTLLIGYVALCVVNSLYFFALPTLLSVAITILVIGALLRSKPKLATASD